MRKIIVPAALVMALAACSSDPVADQSTEVTVEETTPPTTEAPTTTTTTEAEEEPDLPANVDMAAQDEALVEFVWNKMQESPDIMDATCVAVQTMSRADTIDYLATGSDAMTYNQAALIYERMSDYCGEGDNADTATDTLLRAAAEQVWLNMELSQKVVICDGLEQFGRDFAIEGVLSGMGDESATGFDPEDLAVALVDMMERNCF